MLANRALLEAFCRKYGLRRLYAFGSILTSRFGKGSDVDLLYVAERPLDYAKLFDAVEELQGMLGRRVDFIDKRVIEKSENAFRRRSILDSAKVIYEANHAD